MYIRTHFLKNITLQKVNRVIINLQKKMIESIASTSFEKPCWSFLLVL